MVLVAKKIFQESEWHFSLFVRAIEEEELITYYYNKHLLFPIVSE